MIGLAAAGCGDDPTSALKGQSNATMVFYGKAVDQDGLPLAGARFAFRLEAYPKDWTFATRGRPYDVTMLSATSDDRGLFQIELTGCMLRTLKAEREGYRHLDELDGGTSGDGNSVFTRGIRLISWGDLQYKSFPDHPAVFVIVKDGVHQTRALPCRGGFRAHGRDWLVNAPAWPKRPSLADVDWVHGQPRVNAEISLAFKVVDADGLPVADVSIQIDVERYRSLQEMQHSHEFDSTTRTATERTTVLTDINGLATVTVNGFRLRRVHTPMLKGGKWGEGALSYGSSTDYYAREFLDQKGNVVYRCDELNPIVLVILERGADVAHVSPCRGGYELYGSQWMKVEPSWVGRKRPLLK